MTTWEDLVVSATVGAATRPVDLAALPEAIGAALSGATVTDAPGALLDAAAAFTLAERAGRRPGAGAVPPAAEGDPRPLVSRRAATTLGAVVAEGDVALLLEVLGEVATSGRRLPDVLAPDLLTLGARTVALRAPALAVLGPVAPWLARQNPLWAWVSRTAGTTVTGDLDPLGWSMGDAGSRLAHLRMLRTADPAAASVLLATDWATTAPDEREDLLRTLGPVPLPIDEPLLEATLTDRRGAVRELAALLLTRLPGSAFRARAAARAQGVLTVTRKGLRRTLQVTLPPVFDAADRRDGLDELPPRPGQGPGAHRLRQVVARAPLETWTTATGLDAAALVGLPVADLGEVVVTGWVEAAVRQRDAAWAEALLDHHPGAPPVTVHRAELLRVVPVAHRAALVARTLDSGAADLGGLAAVPTPWDDALARTAWTRLRSATRHPQGTREVLTAAPLLGRGLPPTAETVAALRDLADHAPAGVVWAAAVRRAADTVDLRRRLREELARPVRPPGGDRA